MRPWGRLAQAGYTRDPVPALESDADLTTMLDTMTESFCERCGTRYEFGAPEKLTPIRKTRGVISGLKNYIMSQDSLSDSVNDAMRELLERHEARVAIIDLEMIDIQQVRKRSRERGPPFEILHEALQRIVRHLKTLL